MRISDWSSDVCSSDLQIIRAQRPLRIDEHGGAVREDHVRFRVGKLDRREASSRTLQHIERGDQRSGLRNLGRDLRRWKPKMLRHQFGPECGDGGDMGLGPCLDKERSEEHTSELQSLMRISYAVFCLHKK